MNDQTILILMLAVGVCFLVGCVTWLVGHIFGYLQGYDQGLKTGRLIERALRRGGDENKLG